VTVAVWILLAVGVATSLSGAVGVLRMPDVYSRVQASTKNVTMGALPVLIALVVGMGIDTSYAARALIVGGLLLVINPAASHALVRAAWKLDVPQWRGAIGARTTTAAQGDGGPTKTKDA
jgi:multicomponent Na+:H+ antiporter subunit G